MKPAASLRAPVQAMNPMHRPRSLPPVPVVLTCLVLAACSAPEEAEIWQPTPLERKARQAFAESHPELPAVLRDQVRRFEIEPHEALRRYEYLAQHRNTSARLRQLILHGEARVGMSPNHVRAALGEPSNIRTEKKKELWSYLVPNRRGSSRKMTVTFQDQRVVAVEKL